MRCVSSLSGPRYITGVSVSPSTPSECTYTSACVTESAPYCEYLQALLIVAIPCAITPESKTPLFLPYPSPSVRFPTRIPPQCNRANKDIDPLDMISFPSSNSLPPPLRPSLRKSKRWSRQPMTHFLILHLPARASRTTCRKSNDYACASARLRRRDRRGEGDNSYSRHLIQELQGTLADTWGSIYVLHKSRRGEEDGKGDGGSAG